MTFSSEPTKLSVNINKVALLRNSRSTAITHLDLVEVTRICLGAGAHGITIHPRPDQRHIRFADVAILGRFIHDEFPQAEFNIEGNPFEGPYLDLVKEAQPHQCTLVPDAPNQLTSDHGWDPNHDLDALVSVIEGLKSYCQRVSLFIDPRPEWVPRLADSGAHRLELYTESYALAYSQRHRQLSRKKKQEIATEDQVTKVLACFRETAQAAHQLGLGVNAGHDLNLNNLSEFLAHVPDVLEVSIGHALVCDALFLGLEKTVKQYLAELKSL